MDNHGKTSCGPAGAYSASRWTVPPPEELSALWPWLFEKCLPRHGIGPIGPIGLIFSSQHGGMANAGLIAELRPVWKFFCDLLCFFAAKALPFRLNPPATHESSSRRQFPGDRGIR